MQETLDQFLGQEDPWKKDRLPIPVFLGFPGGSAGKESTRNAGDLGSIPGLGRSPGGGKDYPHHQDSGLENSMDYIVHGITKSRTQQSDFHFHLTRVARALPEGCPPVPTAHHPPPSLSCSQHLLASSHPPPGLQREGRGGRSCSHVWGRGARARNERFKDIGVPPQM